MEIKLVQIIETEKDYGDNGSEITSQYAVDFKVGQPCFLKDTCFRKDVKLEYLGEIKGFVSENDVICAAFESKNVPLTNVVNQVAIWCETEGAFKKVVKEFNLKSSFRATHECCYLMINKPDIEFTLVDVPGMTIWFDSLKQYKQAIN